MSRLFAEHLLRPDGVAHGLDPAQVGERRSGDQPGGDGAERLRQVVCGIDQLDTADLGVIKHDRVRGVAGEPGGAVLHLDGLPRGEVGELRAVEPDVGIEDHQRQLMAGEIGVIKPVERGGQTHVALVWDGGDLVGQQESSILNRGCAPGQLGQ